MSEKRPGIDRVCSYLGGNDGPLVLDLGAHTGKTTQMWLDANGATLVTAVEPHRKSFVKLEECFGDNERVKLINAAVSKYEGDAPLYTPDKFKGKDRSQGCTLFRGALKDKVHHGRLTGYEKQLVQTVSAPSLTMQKRLIH